MKKLMIITFLAMALVNGFSQTSTKTTSHSSSISIHTDNDSYMYKASYDRELTQEMKQLMTSKFGKHENINGKFIWYWDNTMEIILKKGKLIMEGEFSTEDNTKMDFIKRLEKEIKAIIN